MSDVIISVENLGKKYRIKHNAERQRYVALRDVIAQKLKAPFQFLKRSQISDLRSPTSARSSSEDFWALKDVSFEVKRGEVVGIIGSPRETGIHPPTQWIGKCTRYVCRASHAEPPFHRGTNGAGKSTLLKILSRITEPTTGRVQFQLFSFQHFSFLEVGTGFHPELTGRENVFLNGSVPGLARREIDATMEDIIDFADLREFIDSPVQSYGSGMAGAAGLCRGHGVGAGASSTGSNFGCWKVLLPNGVL